MDKNRAIEITEKRGHFIDDRSNYVFSYYGDTMSSVFFHEDGYKFDVHQDPNDIGLVTEYFKYTTEQEFMDRLLVFEKFVDLITLSEKAKVNGK